MNAKRKTLPLVSAGLLGLALAATGAVYRVAYHSPNRTQNDDHAIAKSKRTEPLYSQIISTIDRLNAIPYEPVFLTSRDGLRLRGRLYDAPEGAPVAICLHGWRGTPSRDFSGGATMLLQNGWRVLLIEERGQCGSEGHTMTFGAKERLDCLDWARWAAARFGPNCKIVLFGISMGATTVLLASALALPEQVRGIVADCPYADGRDILASVARRAHIPRGVSLALGSAAARIYGQFSLRDTDARKAVRNARVPILILHGEADRFVPPEMSEALQRANPARIERHTFPNASHGMSYLLDPPRYEKLVLEFTKKALS